MKNHNILLVSLILFSIIPNLSSQMASVVNSIADDEFAHPHDKQATPLIDESLDGVCGDSLGRCTFRAALEEAANLGLGAYVSFEGLPQGSIITIDDSQGPFYPYDGSRITGDGSNVEIFGNGGSSVLLIIGNNTQITGMQLDNALIGIEVYGTQNTIGSVGVDGVNIIGGMVQDGILITGDNNKVFGNIIGLDQAGNPNGNFFGIFITGKENVIGGENLGEPNVISANEIGIGVYTIGGDTSGAANYIISNLIGLNPAGDLARGNRIGIDIIGPGLTISRNTISGNTESGVVTGLDAHEIIIKSNTVGLAKNGVTIIPNRDGIVLGPGSFSCKVDSNQITGNINSGILLAGFDDAAGHSTLHYIRGNNISMTQGPGILISGFVTHTTIGSSPSTDFAPNWIHENASGVRFTTLPGLGIPRHNTIRKNTFNDHAGKAINIYTTCATCQEETFPPEITTYEEIDPVTAVITGTHHDAGSTIDIYIADLNLAGHYEGGIWLGSATVDANHDFILTVDNCNCDIVATATNPQGNTSEFTDGEPITTSLQDQLYSKGIVTYPNPFDVFTNISFQLHLPAEVVLEIYDLDGSRIETLIDNYLSEGKHAIEWSAHPNPPGIYYYKLMVENHHTSTGKIIYVK